METEATKKSGAEGEAKTGTKGESLMEMCMSCCGDMSKKEDMIKMMKERCACMPVPQEMRKKWMDCCTPAKKQA